MRKGVLSTRTTRTSRSTGEIAYYYEHLQNGRAVRKGVHSTRTTRTIRSTGEIAYHYGDLQSVRAVRKGSFQLVRLVQVVQLVILYPIVDSYNLSRVMRESF